MLLFFFQIFRGHTAPLNCLVMDDSKSILYTAGGDGLIKSWNLMSGEALKVLRGHEGPIFCLLVRGVTAPNAVEKFVYLDKTAFSASI